MFLVLQVIFKDSQQPILFLCTKLSLDTKKSGSFAMTHFGLMEELMILVMTVFSNYMKGRYTLNVWNRHLIWFFFSSKFKNIYNYLLLQTPLLAVGSNQLFICNFEFKCTYITKNQEYIREVMSDNIVQFPYDKVRTHV